jgi:hypothetical protein
MNTRPFAPYGVIGVAVMAASEIGMLWHVEPFWSWHTPIAWTGYILFVDALVLRRRGSSWLASAPAEFAFLAAVSVPLWLVFEFYNLFIRNWHYVNLPASAFWRDVGYVWSFATIWPAIFETSDLVAAWRDPSGRRSRAAVGTSGARPGKTSGAPERAEGPVPAAGSRAGLPLSRAGLVSIVAGALMLVWPLARPSPYLAAPIWLGFIFLLDPVNARAGGESLTGDFRRRAHDRVVNLMLGGLICGVVWECWNYWARTKWVYTVPILPNLKIFEMPLPGYGGFPAFALECFTMYVTVRLLAWPGRRRPIAL